MTILNLDFLKKWEKEYDRIESDEREYKQILKKTEEEISFSGNITRDNFLDIINWKSPRLKGVIKIGRFEEDYSPIFKEIIKIDFKLEKLEKITSLYGIAVPTGSTILHFFYPDEFPIMDIRTAEALYHFSFLKSKARTITNYSEFYDILNKLKADCGLTFREIDRALFSYHKIRLNKSAFENVENKRMSGNYSEITTRPKMNLNEYIELYYKMSNEEYMNKISKEYIEDKKQREIFMQDGVWTKVRLNYIAGLILTRRGINVFAPKDLQEIVRQELIPSLKCLNNDKLASLLLTQDVHIGAKTKYNNGYPCLEKVGHGEYKFVGFKI